MENVRLGKVFVNTLIVTAAAWTMCFVLSALAGESVQSTLAKVQERTNKSHSVHETATEKIGDLDAIRIETRSQDIEIVTDDQPDLRIDYVGTTTAEAPVLQVERKGRDLEV